VYGLLKVSWGKILSGIIPDIRRIFKIKIAGIRLFARLFKPCKTLSTIKGGSLVQYIRNETKISRMSHII